MTETAPEQRAIDLVRRIATSGSYDNVATTASYWVRDARAIAAELPAPVDPDLVEARRIAADLIGNHSPQMAAQIRRGDGDTYAPLVHVHAGIVRGRVLATQGERHA